MPASGWNFSTQADCDVTFSLSVRWISQLPFVKKSATKAVLLYWTWQFLPKNRIKQLDSNKVGIVFSAGGLGVRNWVYINWDRIWGISLEC